MRQKTCARHRSTTGEDVDRIALPSERDRDAVPIESPPACRGIAASPLLHVPELGQREWQGPEDVRKPTCLGKRVHFGRDHKDPHS